MNYKNNQIPNINQFSPMFYPLPYMPNNPYNFTSQSNQFSLPLPMNIMNQNTNMQYPPILPPMYSDQFLFPNQPLLLPSLFNSSPSSQMNVLNKLLLYKSLLSDNKGISNNGIFGQNNNIKNINHLINKFNQIENNINIYNKNVIEVQISKKLFIAHDNNKSEKIKYLKTTI